MNISFDIDYTDFQAMLTRAQDLTGVRIGLNQAGYYLATKLAIYAAHRSRPQPFKTDKQRRYFFYALRAGIIDVPYQRTNTLANSWLVSQSGLTATVGSRTSYAAIVKGVRQAQYHLVTGHKTAVAVTREEERNIVNFIRRGVGVTVGEA